MAKWFTSELRNKLVTAFKKFAFDPVAVVNVNELSIPNAASDSAIMTVVPTPPIDYLAKPVIKLTQTATSMELLMRQGGITLNVFLSNVIFTDKVGVVPINDVIPNISTSTNMSNHALIGHDYVLTVNSVVSPNEGDGRFVDVTLVDDRHDLLVFYRRIHLKVINDRGYDEEDKDMVC